MELVIESVKNGFIVSPSTSRHEKPDPQNVFVAETFKSLTDHLQGVFNVDSETDKPAEVQV